MNNQQLATRLVRLAKGLTAAINKGDEVQIDLKVAERLMDASEFGALEIYAKKTGGVGIAEAYNQRKDAWIVSIEGARGSFDVPEEALTSTGKQDPQAFEKQLRSLVQVLPVGAKFSNVEQFAENMSLTITTILSAPPMTTDNVSNIEAKLENAVSKLDKFLSGIMNVKDVSQNPNVLMAAQNGEIEFRKEVRVKVDKRQSKKLQTVAEYIENNLTK